MKIGFIGLGNVGGKLAGSLIRNGHPIVVRDLNPELVAEFTARGASAAASPRDIGESCDVIITCLPSPAASAAVAEGPDGFIAAMHPGQVWMEMSTTDYEEVIRLGALVEAQGALFMECLFRVAATAPIPATSRSLRAARALGLTRFCRCSSRWAGGSSTPAIWAPHPSLRS